MSKRSLKRRHFLQSAVCGSAAWALAGVWSERSCSASRSALERLQIAAIGVGNRGADNLVGLRDEQIIALCDVDQRYLVQAQQQLPEARTYRDFRPMLDEMSDLDAVIISTPDHTHAVSAILAMKRGLHVYCEKPLGRTVHEVRAMAAAASEAGVVTQMGNQHHRSLGYRRVKELIDSGVLGTVREVHVWTNRPIWPQGMQQPAAAEAAPTELDWDLWLGPAPERPYNSAYHPFQWRGWWDFGCGALGDMGPHLIDPAFTSLDLSLPTSVRAEHAPVTQQSPPEWSVVRYQFPSKGDRSGLELIWYDGGRLPPAEVLEVERPPANGTLFIGSDARLFAPERGGNPLVLPLPGKPRPALVPSQLEPILDHYADWLHACRTGGRASSDFREAAMLTEICLLGNVAIRSQADITWDAAAMVAVDEPAANELLRSESRDGWSW